MTRGVGAGTDLDYLLQERVNSEVRHGFHGSLGRGPADDEVPAALDRACARRAG
jgi:hypothetical protein